MKTNSSLLPRLMLSLVCIATAGLSGCASVAEKFDGWLASNAQAIAVVDGRVLRGQASFTKEREATVTLQSSTGPGLTCFGPLRFSASTNGWIDFSCSNGQAVRVNFRSLSPLSGTGRGLLGSSEFALTYGLEPEQAAAFLELPVERLLELPAATPTAAPRSEP
jgi:hypothetical protein